MTMQMIEAFDTKRAIADLIESTEYTQVTLAEAIGVTQGRVSQMLNGRDRNSKYETRFMIKKLCDENYIKTHPLNVQ